MNTPAMETFEHRALLYSTSLEFIQGTTRFIREGLAAREPVLVVEPPEKIHLLQAALADAADDVIFADMSQVGANPARIIPAWREFVSRYGSSPKARGVGEPIWSGRSADELVECQRHESLLNVAFGHGKAWLLLCPYDTSSLSVEVIEEARRSHEFVVEGGVLSKSQQFRGIEESGAPFAAPLPPAGMPLAKITFDARSLGGLRALVAKHAAAARLSPMRLEQLVIAVNELAANSVIHGGGRGTLTISRDAKSLICDVRNHGAFHRPLIDRERPGPEDSAPRGLWLANQLCDLVQIRTFRSVTVVRVHMALRRDTWLRVVPDTEPN